MKTLPLYTDEQIWLPFAVETVEAKEPVSSCEDCPRHKDRAMFPINDLQIEPPKN